jgi:hypothetical protein
MSERGRRRIAVLGMVLLTGLALGPSAYAQQTHGDDDASGPGGFVVIEDSSAAPAPPPAPSSAVTTAPLGGATASQAATPAAAPQYKPGTAAYEIPFVKQGASATPASPTAPAVATATIKPGTPVAAAQTKAPGAGTGGAVALGVSPAPPSASLISPPPPTSWDGEAGSDAKTMLLAWAAKAKPSWNVHWDFDHTFPIESPVHYDGTFVHAVSAHFGIYTDRSRTKTPICLDMHEGNHSVHVYARDESNHCETPESKQVN